MANKASKKDKIEVVPQKHIVTAEDLLNNPKLVEDGVKEGDEIELPWIDETGVIGSEELTALEVKMQSYLKSYPNCKKFFVTSDGQVFLSDSEQFAKQHQATLPEEYYEVFEVE